MPRIETIRALLAPSVRKVAIANPRHAPYGVAAVEAMKAFQVYEQVKPKLVLGENIAQTAQFVQSGNADAGIGFLASLERNPEVRGRLQDESEALQLALGKGVSGRVDPRRNMGMGLGLLQDFADRIQGDLWVASGTALLRRRTAVGVRSNTLHSISPWQGAWIALRAEL